MSGKARRQGFRHWLIFHPVIFCHRFIFIYFKSSSFFGLIFLRRECTLADERQQLNKRNEILYGMLVQLLFYFSVHVDKERKRENGDAIAPVFMPCRDIVLSDKN